MNITINYEIDNTSITDFAALEEERYQMSLAAGREAMNCADGCLKSSSFLSI